MNCSSLGMFLVIAGKDNWLGLGGGDHSEEFCCSVVSALAIDALLVYGVQWKWERLWDDVSVHIALSTEIDMVNFIAIQGRSVGIPPLP